MSIRITCINKSGGFHADPHHAIQNLGWVNEDTKATGKNTRLEIYDWIKKGWACLCPRLPRKRRDRGHSRTLQWHKIRSNPRRWRIHGQLARSPGMPLIDYPRLTKWLEHMPLPTFNNKQITANAERVLEQLASKLDISDTHYEAAERSYISVGKWLNRPESTIAQYSPAIYSQGSFRLGTVIRPPSDEDAFDLDIVCELDCTKEEITQKDLKDAVGFELTAYAKRHDLDAPEAGQYCWTINYADSAQFKMDVLPAVPDAAYQRSLLEARKLDMTWVQTAIGLTDSKHARYSVICRDWSASNPRGYSQWFRRRMEQAFLAKRRSMALLEGKANVEKIPEYRVKTPLQAAVQILKRHRDGTFADRPDIRPASIIVTTLAAHAYAQEGTISGALFSILARMDAYIEQRNGVPWIPNPTDTRENFANRWEKEPQLGDAFNEWLQNARTEFESAASLSSDDTISEQLAKHMGRGLLERATAGSSLFPVPVKKSTALSRILGASHKQAPTWPADRLGRCEGHRDRCTRWIPYRAYRQ